ncbi:MAG: VOC family protein [Microthrixaceae bacterium]
MDDDTFVPALTYRDPRAAVDWLRRAFGFELTMAIDGPEGEPENCHYEMALDGRGRLMVGAEWADWTRSPATPGTPVNCSIHVSLGDDLDGHCERARAAGAVVMAEPADQFYGDRTYRCRDPEGHQWTFSMHVRDVTIEEAEAAHGGSIFATDWR